MPRRAHTNLSCKGLRLTPFETVQVYFSSGLYGELPCNGRAAREGARRLSPREYRFEGFSSPPLGPGARDPPNNFGSARMSVFREL